jgi:hypothetical protein
MTYEETFSRKMLLSLYREPTYIMSPNLRGCVKLSIVSLRDGRKRKRKEQTVEANDRKSLTVVYIRPT